MLVSAHATSEKRKNTLNSSQFFSLKLLMIVCVTDVGGCRTFNRLAVYKNINVILLYLVETCMSGSLPYHGVFTKVHIHLFDNMLILVICA